MLRTIKTLFCDIKEAKLQPYDEREHLVIQYMKTNFSTVKFSDKWKTTLGGLHFLARCGFFNKIDSFISTNMTRGCMCNNVLD